MKSTVSSRSDLPHMLFALWVGILLLAMPVLAGSGPQQPATRFEYPLGSPYYPVVLRVDALPFLRNAQANWVSLYAVDKGRLQAIPFQIDQVNRHGRYQIPVSDREKREATKARIDENDELAFMARDLGSRWSGSVGKFEEPLTEIQFTDPETGTTRWLYIRVGQRRSRSDDDYVVYEADGDFIAGRTYRAGFSDATPFLLDHIQLRENAGKRWSDNLVDTMKVHHRGKFLHKFDFRRNHDDYRSRVVAVKDGPVRVIRRTLNNVRMIWILNTPSIEVDFVAYSNSFYVDTLLDIPFRIGKFFADLDTRFSIDWREEAGLTGGRLYSSSFSSGVAIDGVMSPEEHEMNNAQDAQILFASDYGDMLVTLDIPDDLPIAFDNFIQDDRLHGDPPENIPGQFGNFGFLTSNWQALDTRLHHIMFHVYLTPGVDSGSALRMLQQAPLFKGTSGQ